MARFAGTNRSTYTSERVKQMRRKLSNVKSKKQGTPDSETQRCIGKLQAAGHLKISGTSKLGCETEKLDYGYTRKKYGLTFEVHTKDGFEDAPHVQGYLVSASEKDPKYRIKGWFNEDGTIRIELVN